MSDADQTGAADAVQPETGQEEGLLAAHSRAIRDLRERVEELEGENKRIRERNDELESRIEELDSRTLLQQQVESAKSLAVEDRAAICIQTLVNQAFRNKRRGLAPTASMDYNEADNALGGSLWREQLLTALRRADELVEGDVVQFKEESRSSRRNSRLVLDLEKGKIPTTVAGREISRGEADE